MRLKVGAMFAGYGGLEMGLSEVLDVEPAWFAEFDAAPSRILAHHWPDVPNLGDVTRVDWAAVEPVDVITGGYPCQPFSNAGMRRGAADDRHLWPYLASAIEELRPSMVVLENVRAHRSLGFYEVMRDLVALGYTTRWLTIDAGAAGAPHKRARVFMLATHASHQAAEGREPFALLRGFNWWAVERTLFGYGEPARRSTISGAWPAAGVTENQAAFSEPTPCATEPFPESSERKWGEYSAAVARWAAIVGPPPPVVREGSLNTAFSEWMMGLPSGHVTSGAIGLTRDEQRKALGNGVVPRQAAIALAYMMGRDVEMLATPPTPLPTPAVNDMGEGKSVEWWDEWAPRQKSSAGKPAPHGKSLAIEALRIGASE